MSDPFVGQIRLFGCNYAPVGYAQCNGQIMSIAQNSALFALLGTTYGGNGVSTFALPDLQARFAVGGMGSGSPVTMGEIGGSATVTLQTSEMPAHNHTLSGTAGAATANTPAGGIWAVSGSRRSTNNFYTASAGTGSVMSAQAIGTAGGSGGVTQSHSNMSPYLVLNFCIALQGLFPTRN